MSPFTPPKVLNHFIVFGEGHLRSILKTWTEYYHIHRPHQGLGNVPIGQPQPSPDCMTDTVPLGEIVYSESLGGLLKHYERIAA
jgi:putative transposase